MAWMWCLSVSAQQIETVSTVFVNNLFTQKMYSSRTFQDYFTIEQARDSDLMFVWPFCFNHTFFPSSSHFFGSSLKKNLQKLSFKHAPFQSLVSFQSRFSAFASGQQRLRLQQDDINGLCGPSNPSLLTFTQPCSQPPPSDTIMWLLAVRLASFSLAGSTTSL